MIVRRRYAAVVAVVLLAGGSLLAVPASQSPVAAPAVSAPIVLTISGLTGRGTPVASVSAAAYSASPRPNVPRRSSSAPSAEGPTGSSVIPGRRPAGRRSSAAAAPVLPEGISVQEVTGPASSSAGLRPRSAASAVTLANGLQLAADSSTVYTQGAMRYVAATLKVRNAQSNGTAYTAASHNLTLMAAETASSIQQTAVSKMTLFNGAAAAASLAPQLVPADGPVAGQQSLQVFSEDEVAAMTPSAGVTSLLPYGFVVQNGSDPTTRSLPGSPATGDYEGTVTVAMAFPTQTPATNNPFSVSLLLQPVDDTNTRVSQSLQASDADVNARAAALGSADVAVLGDGHATATNAGHPVCSVRTAGTAGHATAYLVNDPGGANVASLPSDVGGLGPTTPARVGFCQPISGTGQLVVTGGEAARPAVGPSGTGTDVLTYTASAAHPWFTGERVSISATAQGFVGQYQVDGATPSQGLFPSQDDTLTGASPLAVAVGDVNGDGIPDVAAAYAHGFSISLGSGDGGFHRVWSEENWKGTVTPTAIAIGDFDGDGLGDVIVTDTTNKNVAIFPVNTNGPADTPTFVSIGTGPTGVVTGDWNGDGHLDFAVSYASGVMAATNTGDGSTFITRLISVSGQGTAGAVAAGNFNGDSNTDLAVAYDSDGRVYTLLGDGTGSFTAGGFATTGNNPVALVAADLNKDGKLDLVSANSTGNSATVMTGDGAGNLGSGSLSFPGANPTGVAVADVTGDGNLDVVVSLSQNNAIQVVRGNGTGSYFNDSAYTVTQPSDLASGDFNGDGLPDIVVASQGSSSLADFVNRGGDALAQPATGGHLFSSTPTTPFYGTTGDFNGDGKLDLVTDDYFNQTLTVELGKGNGTFAVGQNLTLDESSTAAAVVTADFNGDGKLDLAVADALQDVVYFFRGNGDGTFAASVTLAAGSEPQNLVVGDVNGDGLPDLVAGGIADTKLTTFLNNGGFTFTTVTSPGFSKAAGIDLGDFNGDGRLDVAVNANAQIVVGTGDGAGHFTAGPSLGSDGDEYGPVAVGDVNGDAVPDIVVAGDRTVDVYASRAGGGFQRTAYHVPGLAQQVALADVNGDGRADIVAGNVQNGLDEFLNTGSGFSAVKVIGLNAGVEALVLGDFTGQNRIAVASLGGDGIEVVPQRFA